MSEINDDLLNDDTEDFPDIGEADEEALLKEEEDDDVLTIAPEEELEEKSDAEQKAAGSDKEEKKNTRQDKFFTERQRIRAPSPAVSVEKPRFERPINRNRGRGGRYNQLPRRPPPQFNQPRQYNNNNQGMLPGKNKTVLINPRFQGVVHVNNHARLAWDNAPQQFQPNSWAAPNMGPPMQPQPLMQQMQGPPQMQYQPPPMHQQFQGPPQMQPMQGHMPPPMLHQNMGPPGGQFMPPPQPQQQGYVGQPMPPGISQGPIQAPNQMMPYMPNNFEPPHQFPMNNQPPLHQMPPANYPYNNQFGNNNCPPMQQQQPQQNFIPNQPNRQIFHDNRNQRQQFQGNRALRNNSGQTISPKRKVVQGGIVQNKRFVRDRLGTVEQVKVRNSFVKTDDRPSVVKEVTVTNVTTFKIEDDAQTRDLRFKIEQQKKKREEILKWKELRRAEQLKQQSSQEIGPVQKLGRTIYQQNRQQHQHHQNFNTSTRAPVLQQLKRVDDQPRQLIARNHQTMKSDHTRGVAVASAPLVDEPSVELDQKQLSNFLADRKVLVKDEALLSTRKVVIKNIATSTGDKKIFQICKSIGDVQKLHRDKNDRQATITFKSVASAHAFFKKYQRHMLDLSMIEVSLTSDSDGAE